MVEVGAIGVDVVNAVVEVLLLLRLWLLMLWFLLVFLLLWLG